MKTVANWEAGRADPMDEAYPEIIGFLGYEPWPEPATSVERLVAERRRRGLSRKAAAVEIGVDEATLWCWEIGQRVPTHEATKAKVAKFLRQSVLRR